MKGILVGKQVINYTNKTSGNPAKMLVMHVTYNSDRVDGVATEQVRIFGGQANYDHALSIPLNQEILVDYNQRGMVDNIEIL